MNRQSGVTMIEFAALAAIIAIVAALAIPAVKTQFREAKVQQLKENVSLVMLATNAYYEFNCSSASSPTPTIATLVAYNFLYSAEQAENPFGEELVPWVLWGNPTKIQVGAKITLDATPANILNELGGDRVSNGSVYWTELPRVHTNEKAVDIMNFKHMYQPTSCQ